MKKWNDSYLESMYNRKKNWGLNDYKGRYDFTEEELAKPSLSSEAFKTKSTKIWRLLTLAFILGQMSGIKLADDGKTPIELRDKKEK